MSIIEVLSYTNSISDLSVSSGGAVADCSKVVLDGNHHHHSMKNQTVSQQPSSLDNNSLHRIHSPSVTTTTSNNPSPQSVQGLHRNHHRSKNYSQKPHNKIQNNNNNNNSQINNNHHNKSVVNGISIKKTSLESKNLNPRVNMQVVSPTASAFHTVSFHQYHPLTPIHQDQIKLTQIFINDLNKKQHQKPQVTSDESSKGVTQDCREEPNVPASPSTSSKWIQCSGHEGAFLPSKAGTIWKKIPLIKGKSEESFEIEAYKQLMIEDTMRDFIPRFYSEVDYNDDHFMEIQDLLHYFKTSCPSSTDKTQEDDISNKQLFIMDIKMGTRTFLEKEASGPTERSDLYDKMVKIDKNEPTQEEHTKKSVTKLRYMSFRESLSSSSNQGFRIEGVQPTSIKERLGSLEFQKIKDKQDIQSVLSTFLLDNPTLKTQLVSKLQDLRTQFTCSQFFQKHEVIGSSILVIHDGVSKLGVWMIDFAKTVPLPEGVSIDHMSPWKLGNHEDGYLFGLDNLITMVDTL